jgi:nucleotide-binding universal stress UspA family protein
MKTILVLVDFSEHSKNAAKYAFSAAQHYNANVLLYNAYYVPNTTVAEGGMYQQYYGDYSEFEKNSYKKLEELGQELSAAADSGQPGVPKIAYSNDLGRIGDTIKELLLKNDIWFVVMGEKRGVFWEDLLAGSNSASILRNALCPVLLVPDHVKFSPFNLVTLAVSSFGQEEISALNFITHLLAGREAEIRIVHVTGTPSPAAISITEKLNTENIFIENISFYTIKGKDIEEVLEDYVKKEQSDLLVLVRKEHELVEGLLHKSVTRKLIANHQVPSLVFIP